ncbi:hypothetical protein CHOCRA_000076 [Candidatus Hodgkinia cicadicola]|nr:hypothetical protein CHOCRA_000076 [Candidatus Hodgkinia cicadicola]
MLTKVILKTGVSACVIEVHQHSNWILNKLNVKTKIVWAVTTSNKSLPHTLQHCIICNRIKMLRILPESNSSENVFDPDKRNKAANSLKQNMLKSKRLCFYKILTFDYLRQKGLLIKLTNWTNNLNRLACSKNIYMITALFPQLIKSS